ncbi:3'-5' exonuclease [Porphyromonas gingivicanis]|uniref:3'-5' exonuclease n=1 Tax=Porphyromonas gingivicanis TaxID=266762 RepID=UPI0004718B36|nr:3'-5' exonuclease [Porphyromonas gingivicanis]
MNLRPSISKEEISAIEEVASFSGTIHLIETEEEAVRALQALRDERVVGFDTESKPVFRRDEQAEVSLIQIATLTDAYLFRINKIGFTQELCDFITNPDIYKIGLSLHDDYKVMRRKMQLTPQGFVELQKLCPGYGIKDSGLQRIYAILFNERISKTQRVTNWEAKQLTPKQIGYAALDAYACLRIYNFLMKLPRPHPLCFALIQ